MQPQPGRPYCGAYSRLRDAPLGLAIVTLLSQGAALGWHRTAPFGAIAGESSTNSNVQNQPTERLNLAPFQLIQFSWMAKSGLSLDETV